MASRKLSLFLLFLLAFGPCQAGLSCHDLCEVKRTGFCRSLGGVVIVTSGRSLPCATCNTTGKADENQLGCLPGDLRKLQVAGHSDRSGKLKTLPRLGQLLTLILGPGSIRTVGTGAFAPVAGISALSMKKNAIKIIGSWFDGITKLEKLLLSWNEIEEIGENAFQPLRRLRYLELMHNRLRAVEEWHFSSLTYLRYLHLSYNNISHIAGKSFDRLSRLDTLSLDHNKLSFLSTEWLQGLSTEILLLNNNLISIIPAESSLAAMRGVRERISIQENPFRCTCALGAALASRFSNRDRMRCSYPPSLSGRRLADAMSVMLPCPSPTAKVSSQDHGNTLVCEVFWEKRPEIRWLDPRGWAVGDQQPLNPCGGTVTTRLEHDYPTTQSPEGGKAHPPDGLPYIGRSTSTLHMNPQAYRCWTEGSFRCVVKSAVTGSVVADLPLTKSSEPDQRHEDTETTPADYTSTPAQWNARTTESLRIVQTPDKNTRQHSTTPAAHKPQQRTKSATGNAQPPYHIHDENPDVYTVKPTRQTGRMTGSVSKTTEKNSQQDDTATPAEKGQWHTVLMIPISVVTTVVTLVLLAVCRWCYKKRQQQRHYLHGIAAGAIVGIPLRNLQPPATTGNPQPPQHTYDQIPDDTSIAPYAETKNLENPMYNADQTGAKSATSMSPGHNQPANSSQPRHPRVAQAGNAPVPPPRSDRQGDGVSDSDYYPPRNGTTQAADAPGGLPRTNRRVNSNVSAQAQRLGLPATRRSRSSSLDNRRASRDKRRASYRNRRASYDSRDQGRDEEEDVEGPNLYLDLNSLSGSDMAQAAGANSNVSARPKRLGMATTPRNRGASYEPQGLGRDDEEEVEGANLYLDLNGPPRHSGSDMPQAEAVPDPLLRTNRYVNSNVSARPQGSDMPQAERIPDPLPSIHTYVNCNVSAQQQQRLGMSATPRNSEASYENSRDSYDNQRASYDNRGDSYDHLRRASYDNRRASYDNRGASYDNRGASYDNRWDSYDNRGASYDNCGASYGNRGASYDIHGTSYDHLRRTSYDNNRGASYDNHGTSYDNDGASYDHLRRAFYDNRRAVEDRPDPLPRTNTYVNPNVSAHPQGSDTPQAERIPDPLPRIHTYVNCNVSAPPRR